MPYFTFLFVEFDSLTSFILKSCSKHKVKVQEQSITTNDSISLNAYIFVDVT